jgi:hypothetical protein
MKQTTETGIIALGAVILLVVFVTSLVSAFAFDDWRWLVLSVACYLLLCGTPTRMTR